MAVSPRSTITHSPPRMHLITEEESREYVAAHKEVRIEGVRIPIGVAHQPKKFGPPNSLERTTVWSFPDSSLRQS